MSINSRKVAVIGTGLVGSTCAYAIANQGVCDEVLMIDANIKRAEGEAWDIGQSISFLDQRTKIYPASFSDCSDVDIIVFSAGGPPKVGETRLDSLGHSIKIADSVIDEVLKSGFNGIFLVVSNPVDVVSYYFFKKSGFPAHRVIGSGTSLDSSRLKYFLSEICGNVDPHSINGFTIGEHGDSQTVAWSTVTIGGVPYLQLREQNPEKYAVLSLEEIRLKVVKAGWDIIERKNTTYYGVASAATNIIKAIMNDEKRISAASTFLNGEYGEKNIFSSVPVILGKEGIEKVIELNLTSEELENFKKSNSILRKYIETL